MHRRSLRDIQAGATEDCDAGNSPTEHPEWLDMEKFERGQEFFKKHIAMIVMFMHFSLITGFSITNLIEPLMFTRNSDTPDRALRRYISTFHHVLLWCTENIWDSKTEGHKSTQKVRKGHNAVAAKMNSKFNDKKYISQYDLALVQSGFMGAVTLCPERFGIKCTEQEIEDYCYLWRCIGYLIGIDDKYNLCSGDYRETYDILKEIEKDVLIPSMQNTPKEFTTLADAYTGGMNKVSPLTLHTKESVFGMSFKEMGVEMPAMGWGDWCRFATLKTVLYSNWYVPGMEGFLNKRMHSLLDHLFEKVLKQDTMAKVGYTE